MPQTRAHRTHTRARTTWSNGNFIQNRFASDTHFFGAEAANCNSFSYEWAGRTTGERETKRECLMSALRSSLPTYLRSGRPSTILCRNWPISHNHGALSREHRAYAAIVFSTCAEGSTMACHRCNNDSKNTIGCAQTIHKVSRVHVART